jgi:GTPase SAR1 family protein
MYFIGPAGSGKTSFIHRYLKTDYEFFKDFIIESTEIVMPTDYIKVFLILPTVEIYATRSTTLSATDRALWMELYLKNKDNIVLVENNE